MVEQNIEYPIIKGDIWTIEVTIVDENDTPVDLTGKTLKFVLKENRTDLDDVAIISKYISSHTDAINGITTITLSEVETSSLLQSQESGKFLWYGIKDITSKETIAQGKVQVKDSLVDEI